MSIYFTVCSGVGHSDHTLQLHNVLPYFGPEIILLQTSVKLNCGREINWSYLEW